jgi:hypothetical protein
MFQRNIRVVLFHFSTRNGSSVVPCRSFGRSLFTVVLKTSDLTFVSRFTHEFTALDATHIGRLNGMTATTPIGIIRDGNNTTLDIFALYQIGILLIVDINRAVMDKYVIARGNTIGNCNKSITRFVIEPLDASG